MYLLTYSGRILCYSTERDRLEQVTFDDAIRSGNAIALPLDASSVETTYRSFVESADATWQLEITAGPLSGYLLQSSDGSRVVTLVRAGHYLCAEAASAGGAIKSDRTTAAGWEHFLCIDIADFESIQRFKNEDRVIGSTREVVRKEQIQLGEGFALRMNTMSFDLRYNLPLDLISSPFRTTLFREGWRVEQIHLFNPIIIFTAFRSNEVVKQLYIALDSLIRFGGYTGAIRLITDQAESAIRESVPNLADGQLSVRTCNPADWVGFVAAKYLMIEDPDIFNYQPVIFSDPDMVFDSNITTLLAATAASSRIAAPTEHDSPLHSKVSTGAVLLREDGCNPHHVTGFNAGTLAIPNLVDHRDTIDIIRKIILNRSRLKGRNHHRWVDQEIANYVSFKTSAFDQNLITPFVRYGYAGVEERPQDAVGVVHFWPPDGSARKRESMERYIKALEQRLVKGKGA